MTVQDESKPYTLEFDEKVTPVMVYMEEALVWGEVVSKEVIRVSTWLRTPMVPQNITLFNAQFMYGYGTLGAPLRLTEIHIPLNHIYAWHMMPPHEDPVDYDATEPNRKMEPGTALVGPFRFDGHLRMATATDLKKFLDVVKQIFTPMYDIKISQPQRPQLKSLQIPYMLVRTEVALFCK